MPFTEGEVGKATDQAGDMLVPRGKVTDSAEQPAWAQGMTFDGG
ncbi:hypothetical protein NKDENANG_01515 [Candidatus Entotheonellaceae bacterium PAL068K]